MATSLFLKAADGHIAVIHSDKVPVLMVLSHIEVPMGFKPRLAISDCSERERACAVRIQRVGAFQFLAADLAPATGRLFARKLPGTIKDEYPIVNALDRRLDGLNKTSTSKDVAAL